MKYDCLILFSGGLDSILTVKILKEQHLRVLGIHFVSPFFGDKLKIKYWREKLGIEINIIDISKDYIEILKHGPEHGFGKNLNPCRDCKILMLKKLKGLIPEYGAEFIATGEVAGQRAMSQTFEALKLIEKQAGVEDILLRPLSAKKLPETKPERERLVNRDKLPDLNGRGREKQIKLAKEYGIKEKEIPTPAGGCFLTQKELSKRYAQVLKNIEKPEVIDFEKCNIGRHYWKNKSWLIVGRDREENERLFQFQQKDDIFMEMLEPTGPSALLKIAPNEKTADDMIEKAVSITAFFSPKARDKEKARLKINSAEKDSEINCKPEKPESLNWQHSQNTNLENFKKML